MAENQEFNWEEVSEVTSDVEKKNPIGNEQVIQSQSQDGPLTSLESDLEVQSTSQDDKDKGVKYYTKTDKNGKTTYWKKDKWGEKAITKTTYDFENKKQVEDKMATNAEFTEVVPLDKQSDVDKMLQVDVPIAQEPKQPIEPKVEEPKKEEDLSWFGDFAGRFDRAVLGLGADALKWIGIAASKIDKITGSEPNKKTEDYATYKWGQQLDEFIKDSFPTDVSRDEDFTSSIATGLGSIAGFAIAGPARTAFFGAASQSVPEYENAKQIVTDANSLTLDDFINKYTDPNADELSKNEIDANLEQQWFDLKGKNPEDVAFKSFMANSVIGASEALPINMAIGRIGKAGSSRFKDALVNAVSGGSEEAIQEGMTQYFSNLTTQQLLDENKNVLDGVAEATGTAFVLGGVLNGTLTALTGRYEQSEGKEKEELKSQIDRVKELQSRLPVDGNETVVTLKSKEELQNDINEFETKVNTHNEYVSNISNPDNLAKIASSISIDGGKLVEEFVNDVDDKVQKGYITTEQGEQAKQSLKTLLQANDKVPASIDNIEKRGQAVKLVAEKSILEEEIKDKDKALSAPQLERIKQINEELTNIALGKEPVVQEEVKSEEKTIEESQPQEALKDVESTAKALGGVDEANMAKIILPETQVKQKVYHGGESKIVGDFKNLNPNLTGFYFSSDIDNAKTYGNEIVEAYVDIKNPLIIDAKGLKFTDDIPVEAVFTYPNEKPYTSIINLPIDDVVYAVKNGKRPNQFFEIKNREKYDGVIFKNLIDPALTSRREIPQDTIVAFENSQIKRADNKSISEAYHKAKADGSNPELVKAVEDLLGKKEEVVEPTEQNKEDSIVIAQRIRDKKIGGKGQLYSSIDFGLTQAVYDGALEFCARQVESGNTIGKAIENTIKWIDEKSENKSWNKKEFENHLKSNFNFSIDGNNLYVAGINVTPLLKYSGITQGDLMRTLKWMENNQIIPGDKKTSYIRKDLFDTINGKIDFWQRQLDKEKSKIINRDGDIAELRVKRIEEYQDRVDDLKKLRDIIDQNLFSTSDVKIKTLEERAAESSKKVQEAYDELVKALGSQSTTGGPWNTLPQFVNLVKALGEDASIKIEQIVAAIRAAFGDKIKDVTDQNIEIEVNKILSSTTEEKTKEQKSKIKQANVLKAKARKFNTKVNKKNIPFDLMNAINQLRRINTSKLEDVDLESYIKLLETLNSEGIKSVQKRGETNIGRTFDVNNFISQADALSKKYPSTSSVAIDNITALQRKAKKLTNETNASKLIERYNNGEITEEDFQKIVDGLDEDALNEIEKQTLFRQSDLQDFVNSTDMSLYSDYEQMMLRDLLNADVSKFNKAQKLLYIDAVNSIINQDSFIGVGEAAALSRATKMLSEVLKLKGKVRELGKNKRKILGSMANKSLIYDLITKTQDASIALRKALNIYPIINNAAGAKKKHDDYIKKYNDIISKYKKKNIDLNSPESDYRAHIISDIFQFTTDESPEFKEDRNNEARDRFLEIKNDILKMESLKDGKNDSDKEMYLKGQLLKKALDSLGITEDMFTKVGITEDMFTKEGYDYVYNKIAQEFPGETELVEMTKKEFENNADRFKENTEIGNNKKFDKIYNYGPTRAVSLSSSEKDIFEEQAKGRETVYRKQVGSSFSRTGKGPNTVGDYNFGNNASKVLLEQLLDSEVQRETIIANYLLKSKEAKEVVGEDILKILRENLIDKLNVDYRTMGSSSSVFDFLGKPLTNISKRYVKVILGSIDQLLKQVPGVSTDATISYLGTDNFARGTMLMGKVMPIPFFNSKENIDPNLIALLNHYPISERLRNNPTYLFDVTENDIKRAILDKGKSIATREKEFNDKFSEYILASLKRSDNAAAVATWFGAYVKYLKDNKGIDFKDINWAEEATKKNTDAGNYAESIVDRTQSVSDPSLLPRVSTSKDLGARLLRSTLMPLSTFNLNQKMRLLGDVQNLKTDTGVAGRSLTGAFIGIMTYNAIVLALSESKDIATDLAAELFFGIKFPEEKDKEEEDLSAQGLKMISESAYDMTLGGVFPDADRFFKWVANLAVARTNRDEIERLEKIMKNVSSEKAKEQYKKQIKELEKDAFYIPPSRMGTVSMGYDLVMKTYTDSKKELETLEKSKTSPEYKNAKAKYEAAVYLLGIMDFAAVTGYSEGFANSIKEKMKKKLKKDINEKFGPGGTYEEKESKDEKNNPYLYFESKDGVDNGVNPYLDIPIDKNKDGQTNPYLDK